MYHKQKNPTPKSIKLSIQKFKNSATINVFTRVCMNKHILKAVFSNDTVSANYIDFILTFFRILERCELVFNYGSTFYHKMRHDYHQPPGHLIFLTRFTLVIRGQKIRAYIVMGERVTFLFSPLFFLRKVDPIRNK